MELPHLRQGARELPPQGPGERAPRARGGSRRAGSGMRRGTSVGRPTTWTTSGRGTKAAAGRSDAGVRCSAGTLAGPLVIFAQALSPENAVSERQPCLIGCQPCSLRRYFQWGRRRGMAGAEAACRDRSRRPVSGGHHSRRGARDEGTSPDDFPVPFAKRFPYRSDVRPHMTLAAGPASRTPPRPASVLWFKRRAFLPGDAFRVPRSTWTSTFRETSQQAHL